eukprot:4801398-Amphidinium_carterae.1
MDSQLPYLSTYASTASRLSQRLIISIAVTNRFELKTVDISTAFLQFHLRKHGLKGDDSGCW